MKHDEELERLFDRALAGDRDAYQSFLEAIALRLRTEFESEDHVQATLVGIHEKRDLYRTGMPIMPWVRLIARDKTNRETVGRLGQMFRLGRRRKR